MTKRYSFVSKRTGKPAKIRKVHTRAEARFVKNTNARDLLIRDDKTGLIVR